MSQRKMIIGAAVGTLIGSLSMFILNKRPKLLKQLKDQSLDWAEAAKDVGERVYDEIRTRNPRREVFARQKFAKGTMLGVLLGLGTAALMLTPNSRKQLRKNLTQGYMDLTKKSQDFIHTFNNNQHPAKKVARHAKSKVRSALKK